MSYIATNLTKLQLIHGFSLGIAKNSSCSMFEETHYPAAAGCSEDSADLTRHHLEALASGSHTWPDLPIWMTGEHSQQVLLTRPHTAKNTLEENTTEQAPSGLTQNMTNSPSGWHFLQGSGAQPWPQERITKGTYNISAARPPAPAN